LAESGTKFNPIALVALLEVVPVFPILTIPWYEVAPSTMLVWDDVVTTIFPELEEGFSRYQSSVRTLFVGS
jgi:hypothetical protein